MLINLSLSLTFCFKLNRERRKSFLGYKIESVLLETSFVTGSRHISFEESENAKQNSFSQGFYFDYKQMSGDWIQILFTNYEMFIQETPQIQKLLFTHTVACNIYKGRLIFIFDQDSQRNAAKSLSKIWRIGSTHPSIMARLNPKNASSAQVYLTLLEFHY